jgi:hypothetical protein
MGGMAKHQVPSARITLDLFLSDNFVSGIGEQFHD